MKTTAMISVTYEVNNSDCKESTLDISAQVNLYKGKINALNFIQVKHNDNVIANCQYLGNGLSGSFINDDSISKSQVIGEIENFIKTIYDNESNFKTQV